MDESPTVAQSLAKVRDAESAFAFIEWFAREWLTPIRDGDGCTAEEVAAAEERLGLRLPASLAAFYRLLGRRRDLTCNQDRLIALKSLTVQDGALVYRIENQACASWGVPISDLSRADPPTVFREGYREGRPWRPFLGSFSQAAVELVLGEALFSDAEGRNDNRELDEAGIVRLEQLYERLPFPDYPAWWQPEVSLAVRWFSGPGVVLREDSQSWIWVLAQNATGIARVRDALPGEWLMAELLLGEDSHRQESCAIVPPGRSGGAAGIGRALRGPLLGPRLRGRFPARARSRSGPGPEHFRALRSVIPHFE